jgi:hypothetical protein
MLPRSIFLLAARGVAGRSRCVVFFERQFTLAIVWKEVAECKKDMWCTKSRETQVPASWQYGQIAANVTDRRSHRAASHNPVFGQLKALVRLSDYTSKWNLWGEIQNAPQGQTLSGWGCGAISP